MMALFEIIPVLLFFLAFKFYGIYVATVTGMAATAIQVLITRFALGFWDKKQLITLAVFVIFGSMTLYFHDPIFVKWKPTIVFWIFAIVILLTQWLTDKPLMQRLLANAFEGKGEVPTFIWKKINFIWAILFIGLGAINLYIAYHYNNEIWVNFKFYGITLTLLVFAFLQALFLLRYLTERGTSK